MGVGKREGGSAKERSEERELKRAERRLKGNKGRQESQPNTTGMATTYIIRRKHESSAVMRVQYEYAQ